MIENVRLKWPALRHALAWKLACSQAEDADDEEEQIYERADYRDIEGALRWAFGGWFMSETPDQWCYDLQIAGEVRWYGRLWCQKPVGSWEWDQQTEAFSGGVCDGHGDAKRNAHKKLLTPDSKRDTVDWAISKKSYTQRKATGLAGLGLRTYWYQPRRPDEPALPKRLRENWLLGDDGFATFACICCRNGRASWCAVRRRIGCTAKKSSQCPSVLDASGPWAHKRQ
jgi:hypothetical protein